MKRMSREPSPVNLDSGQHRDLEEIIESLRKDIIVSNRKNRGASSEPEDNRPDSASARRGGVSRKRAGAFHRGLLGVGRRIPA